MTMALAFAPLIIGANYIVDIIDTMAASKPTFQ